MRSPPPGESVRSRKNVRKRYEVVRTLRSALGVAGTLLLGGALALAPIAAFTGEMLMVTKAALAGVALLIIMKLLPRPDAASESRPDPLDNER